MRFFVGGYTEPSPTPQPQGVSTCLLDPASGAMRVQHTQSGVINPSYLARRDGYLLAVKEVASAENPAVLELEIGAAGTLTLSGSSDVPGDAPCHLACDPGGRFFVVACYSSGNVVLYTPLPGGALSERQIVQHHDTDALPPRPARDPHAHQAVFGPDGNTLFVTDLGLDEIRSYRLGAGHFCRKRLRS